jgi:CDP-diacylglycerol pyrophosphatase
MTSFLRLTVLVVLLGVILASRTAATPTQADHPNALWDVVHGLCVRDKWLTGGAAPCLAVDRKLGVAVVPDPRRPTQVLVVPTKRLAGIESPGLLDPDAVNYWQAAWDDRRYFEHRARREVARDRIGMAINSAFSRSQNQLHIHVDCVRSDVRQALMARADDIGPVWRTLRTPLVGRLYRVRRLEGADLGARNPFQLLARGNPAARQNMAAQSLAVIGATFPDGSPGFFLLNDGRPGAFAESLLDHDCAVLEQP